MFFQNFITKIFESQCKCSLLQLLFKVYIDNNLEGEAQLTRLPRGAIYLNTAVTMLLNLATLLH